MLCDCTIIAFNLLHDCYFFFPHLFSNVELLWAHKSFYHRIMLLNLLIFMWFSFRILNLLLYQTILVEKYLCNFILYVVHVIVITTSHCHDQIWFVRFLWYLFMFFTLLYFIFYGIMVYALSPNPQLWTLFHLHFIQCGTFFLGFINPRMGSIKYPLPIKLKCQLSFKCIHQNG